MNKNNVNYFIWFLILCFTYIIIWNNIPIYEGLGIGIAIEAKKKEEAEAKKKEEEIEAAATAAQQSYLDAQAAVTTATNLSVALTTKSKQTNNPSDIAAAKTAQQSTDAANVALKEAAKYTQSADTYKQSKTEEINAKVIVDNAQNQYNIDLQASIDADAAEATAAAA